MHKLAYLCIFAFFLYFCINSIFVKKKIIAASERAEDLHRISGHSPEQVDIACTSICVSIEGRERGTIPPRALREYLCPALPCCLHAPLGAGNCCTEKTLLSPFYPTGLHCTACSLTLSD